MRRVIYGLLLLALPALLAPAAVGAQTVVIDEGVFTLLVSGREVGTERFRIERRGTGEGAIIIARGRVVIDTAGAPTELDAVLQASGASLRPVRYRIKVRGDGAETIAGRMTDGRFSATITSPAGRMRREFLVSEGAVLVDQGIAHHYYFVAQRIDGRSTFEIPLLVPRLNRQVTARVVVEGTETVRIGGQPVQARRVRIDPDGLPVRTVWVDAEGRVLRLEIPVRSYVAVRQAPPAG